jgi:hypothetical protein
MRLPLLILLLCVAGTAGIKTLDNRLVSGELLAWD